MESGTGTQKTERAACCVCLGNKPTRLFEHKGYHLVRCGNCGLIYTLEVPTPKELEDHYLSVESIVKDSFQRRVKTKCLLWIIERFTKIHGDFLDVGCSQGDFGIAARRSKKWHYTGIDYPTASLEYARSLGLNVVTGTIEEARFPSEHFALVTMFHVLEHLVNPREVLLEVARVTAPDGLLVIGVPNAGHWRAKLEGPKWRYIGPPGHLWYFSPRTLKMLLEAVGFRAVLSWAPLLKCHLTVFARKM